jgi:hypothetical protein
VDIGYPPRIDPIRPDSTTASAKVSRRPTHHYIGPSRKVSAAEPTPAQRRRAELDTEVAKFPAASVRVYSAPRIPADLRADGERVSQKVVAGMTKQQELLWATMKVEFYER